MVLKFEGIDSINDAEPLIGAEIQIPLEERAPLEDGATYVTDLEGCRVFVAEKKSASNENPQNTLLREIGVVFDVTFTAGEAPILEIRDGKKEYLVPLAQEYIRRLDISAKQIEFLLPGGMLDLDAPLSKEEKDAQNESDLSVP